MTEPRRILVVDDDSGQRRILEEFLAARGYRVRSAPDAESAIALMDEVVPDLVLMDVRMPGMGGLRGLEEARRRSPVPAVILLTAYADLRDAVEAMRLGAVDYLEKPVDLDELATVVAETIGVAVPGPREDLPPLPRDLIVASGAMRRVVGEALLVAPTEATVLITGESGTGKERVAELIHARSRRSALPFVRVNCAAIPENLVESELFGHRRGAFTSADADRVGRFETAAGGTILLDEVGELPLLVQPKLLRVLENGSFERVGESAPRRADVRVIASTNRDLEREVARGTFREDLFWRLNVFRIHLSPMRERAEEVPLLARAFLARAGREGVRISPAALRLLEAYRWPGNVREISNVVERAAILAAGDVVLPEHLPPSILGGGERPPSVLSSPAGAGVAKESAESVGTSSDAGGAVTVEEAERQAIRRALAETQGNRSQAAKLLGISRRTLLYRLKRYGGEP
jgi:DNA-binding NtrC family response regulator